MNINKNSIGGLLTSNEEKELNQLSNWIFDDMIKILYNHKYDVNKINEQQKHNLKNDFYKKKQEALQLFDKKQAKVHFQAPVQIPVQAQIPYDYNKLQYFGQVFKYSDANGNQRESAYPKKLAGSDKDTSSTKFYIMANLKDGTPLYNSIEKIVNGIYNFPEIQKNQGKKYHMTLLELETNNTTELFKPTKKTDQFGNKLDYRKQLGTSKYCENIKKYTDFLSNSFASNIGSKSMNFKSTVALPINDEKFVALEYEMSEQIAITKFRKDFYDVLNKILGNNAILLGHSGVNAGDDKGYVYYGYKGANRDSSLYAVKKYTWGTGIILPHISISSVDNGSSIVINNKNKVEEFIKNNNGILNLDIKSNYFDELYLSLPSCEETI